MAPGIMENDHSHEREAEYVDKNQKFLMNFLSNFSFSFMSGFSNHVATDSP